MSCVLRYDIVVCTLSSEFRLNELFLCIFSSNFELHMLFLCICNFIRNLARIEQLVVLVVEWFFRHKLGNIHFPNLHIPSVNYYFCKTQYNRKRSHIHAYTQPYERITHILPHFVASKKSFLVFHHAGTADGNVIVA